MRTIGRTLKLVSFSLWLVACAADDVSDEQQVSVEAPEGSPADEHESASSQAAATSDQPSEPAIGPAAADDAAPASEDPQARIFGFGTSCTQTTCRNGGTCVEQWLGYTCRCPAGFTGTQCQTASGGGGSCPAPTAPTNGTVSTPQGRTVGAQASYACRTGFALSGASTRTCQSNLTWSGSAPSCVASGANSCASNPCQNGGTCNALGASYTCTCPPGYSGASCQTNTNDCAPTNPCRNGGTCVDGLGTWSCACPAGYSGPSCEREICGSIFITSPTALQNARNCAVIQGNLQIAGAGLSAITASDFPFLTSVTGEVSVSSFAAQQSTPVLTTLTLANLQSVGGRFQIAATTGLRTASFPALTSVGSIMSVTGSVVDWSMPQLTTVNGGVDIRLQSNLCTFSAPRVTTVRGPVSIGLIPKVPASAFAPIVDAARRASQSVEQSDLGCCISGGSISCQGGSSDYECGC